MDDTLHVNYHFVNLRACECVYGFFSVYMNDFWGGEMWYGVVADFSFVRPFPNSLFRAYWSFKKKHPAFVIIFIEHIWVFPKIGVPQNGWFIMEHPIKMDVHFMSVWYHELTKSDFFIHRISRRKTYEDTGLMLQKSSGCTS